MGGSYEKVTPNRAGESAGGESTPPSGPNISVPSKVSPKSLLLPYQLKWVNDHSRFKYGLWSRQTGKDFSSTEEIVEDCLQRPKTTWLIGAAGERQALESLSKAKEWAEAYKLQIENYVEDRESAQALIRSAEITWSNGSRVMAVPANPDTVRGFSANLLLTEFAFLEKPSETWRAIVPSITNPLRGGQKKVRIVTTPNGKGNKAFDLWDKNHGNKDGKWSCHLVTIHDAVRQGLPIDIEELKAALDDPEGWLQEFECQFLDGSNVLLPYELIALAESFEASEVDPAVSQANNRFFTGIDFGRQNDPTVCWTLELVGDVLVTREVLVLHQTSTVEQNQILDSRIRAAKRVCVDYTGPGVGFGDYAVHSWGEYKPEEHNFGRVELCTFTAPFKRELFPLLRRKFEAPCKLRIPISIEIREDLHAMQQIVRNGEYNYWAPRTKEGHSDRCTALALAVRASRDFLAGTISSLEGCRVGGNRGSRGGFRPRWMRRDSGVLVPGGAA
jgi:phage FluMu gp28-like protein